MKNLFISIMVLGICALSLDAANWIGQPYTELIKQYDQNYRDTGRGIVYDCGTFQVSFSVDMYGNIKSIWVGKLRPKGGEAK